MNTAVGKTSMVATVVIVGKGSAGNRHAQLVAHEYPSAKIVHLSARWFLSQCSNRDYFEGLISEERPDLAIVASDAISHPTIAIPFLEAGIPVLIEKPLAAVFADAVEITAVAQRTGTPVMVGYVMRHYEDFQIVKELLSKCVIGRPHFGRFEVGQFLPDWRPGSDYRRVVSSQAALGGGVLLELSHEIDLAIELFGLPSAVVCKADRLSDLEIDVEDFATISLTYPETCAGPRRVEIQMDFIRRVPTRRLEIHGSEGSLVWDVLRQSVRYYSAIEDLWTAVTPSGFRRSDPYAAQLAAFLGEDSQGMRSAAEGHRALEVLRIIEACRRFNDLVQAIPVRTGAADA